MCGGGCGGGWCPGRTRSLDLIPNILTGLVPTAAAASKRRQLESLPGMPWTGNLFLGRVAYCPRLLNLLLLILRESSLVSSVLSLQETLSISHSYPTKWASSRIPLRRALSTPLTECPRIPGKMNRKLAAKDKNTRITMSSGTLKLTACLGWG